VLAVGLGGVVVLVDSGGVTVAVLAGLLWLLCVLLVLVLVLVLGDSLLLSMWQ